MSTTIRRPKIYLAGPEVFLRNAAEIGAEKKRICEDLGAMGLFPLDNEIDHQGDAQFEIARAIYRANVGLITRADCGIANLTPFRGPNVDDGTAFEIGVLLEQNKPVFGYANTTLDLAGRVSEFYGQDLECDTGSGALHGSDGMFVEDFGLPVNLMIACSIQEAGGRIILHQAKREELFCDLTAFRQCVTQMVHRFSEAVRRQVHSGMRGGVRD